MEVVALVSGGKDSCYAMMKCIQYGHKIVALANLMPADDKVDELDSYMYQTVGHQIIVGYAECMGLPLFRRRIRGTTRDQNLSYKMTLGDEVEDLFILLSEIKRQIPSITAVSSGAIASDYQRLRVESICSRLELVSLAYLWKQDQSLLLNEMISNGIVAIFVKVAALGLDPAKHLGKELTELNAYLHKLKELYGINVCGEGGEYETLTLDCPLFTNAHILLTEFQVILHSSDAIAPVGVLHPLVFHLLKKEESTPLNGRSYMSEACHGNNGFVYEVMNDCLLRNKNASKSVVISNSAQVSDCRLKIIGSKKDSTFSLCCWLTDGSESAKDLQEDLQVILQMMESKLLECGSDWASVLYIHLYIADMSGFSSANQMYVKYITQDKCPFGVPSRSTIELPLSQVGLGKAYVEALVASEQSKQVLHVQSISCWAPSCIGPYSQATLHNKILYMAGQLGLDPPTMLVRSGGLIAEMEQALENSEAIAKSFKCSISSSAILLVAYCSKKIPLSDRTYIQEKMDSFLKQKREEDLEGHLTVLDPNFIYITVPDLPKQALVEIKPVLYVAGVEEIATDAEEGPCITTTNAWGFQHESWHDSGIQKCLVEGSVCAVTLSISEAFAAKICSSYQNDSQTGQICLDSSLLQQMKSIARFSIYSLDKVMLENKFNWKDVITLRIYFPTSMGISMEKYLLIFSHAFEEFARMSQRIKLSKDDPVFNLVPVLGAGSSPSSMNDLITFELFAQKLPRSL